MIQTRICSLSKTLHDRDRPGSTTTPVAFGRLPNPVQTERCRRRLTPERLAFSSVGFMEPASAAPSHWQSTDEEFSEVFEACPGVTVSWELHSTGESRFTTRGMNDFPLYEEH